MAVPKKQTSHARKGWRRSHWHLTTPSPAKCSHCGAPCRPHRVCRECGHYGKREVLVVKS